MNLWSGAQAWQAGGENLFRHKDAYYFLPSEDEWYKAAFHKNDGVTANYWDYATGSNTVPVQALVDGTTPFTAVFDDRFVPGVPADPADVNLAGGLSAYGTMGQNGNVWEWAESAFDGINNSSSEYRAFRGGDWGDPEDYLRSSIRNVYTPTDSAPYVGFRVASVPEPSSLALLAAAAVGLAARRSRKTL
jgi:formylglycine-generating enzyme required for sulfatase activity